MTPKIFVHPEFQQPDLLRLDVLSQNLPQNFLGIAFDLVVPGRWTFDHEELCGSFVSMGPEVMHLVSVRPGEGRVVFGLARTDWREETGLKQVGATTSAIGQTAVLDQKDECLARFYFDFSDIPQKSDVLFEHTSLSVYENGRRDVENVQWQGSSVPDSGLTSVYQFILAFLILVLAGFGLCLLYYRLWRQR